MGSYWGHVGPSWAILRLPWAPLGPSWGHLGASWGHRGLSWAILAELRAKSSNFLKLKKHKENIGFGAPEAPKIRQVGPQERPSGLQEANNGATYYSIASRIPPAHACLDAVDCCWDR